MDDDAGAAEDRLLSIQLDLHLDRQPISGRLRTEWGADERFVGWLGFVDALNRLHDLEATGANMSEATSSPMPTLVAGGTGKTGRRVAARLAARGVPTRIGSRSGRPPFDWADRSTWGPALEGMQAAYIAYYPDVAVASSVDAIRDFAELALAAGCRRLVLVSGRGEVGAQRAEEALQASGAEWTIVRCSWFMQNFSENFMVEMLAAGELALPAGDVRAPFVDVDDIADVAVAALTEDGHAGRAYDLTGPDALTHAEAVEEIGRAARRSLQYVEISMDDFVSALAEQDVPAEVIDLLRYLFTDVLVDANASVAHGVEQALGRAPRNFRDYARAAAATGVWQGTAVGIGTQE